MNKSNTILSAAIGSILLMGVVSSNAMAAEGEKCFGVAKAGHNGCNSNKSVHSCRGKAITSGDAHDFVKVPKGTCEKLANGSIKPGKENQGVM